MILVFPSIERKHGRDAIAFTHDMRPFEVDGEEIVPTGDSLIFADMIEIAVRQGMWIFGLSGLVILILLRLQLHKMSEAFNAFLSLLLGLSLMAIILRVLAVDINFYNMAIFAAVVGMGIDSGIHLYASWLRLQRDPEITTASHMTVSGKALEKSSATKSLSSLGDPLTASMLTTIAGYVGMLQSNHSGLRSIGALAVIGLGSCFLAAITIFPIYLRWLEGRVPKIRPAVG